MDFLRKDNSKISFSGSVDEAIALSRMPVNDSNKPWIVTLSTIVTFIGAVPNIWKKSSANISYGDYPNPDAICVEFVKDGVLALHLTSEGVRILHLKSQIRGKPCPLPKHFTDIAKTIKQAQLNFLEELSAIVESAKEGL